MNRLLLLSPLVLVLCFWGARCETTKDETRLAKIDSLKTITDSLIIEAQAWKNLASINHLAIERLNAMAQDLSHEIEARDEQIAKFKNRLDSAAAIIKRQNEQLANCIYSKRPPIFKNH